VVSSIALFVFSSRSRHTRFSRDWSSDVCSSDLIEYEYAPGFGICQGGRVRPGLRFPGPAVLFPEGTVGPFNEDRRRPALPVVLRDRKSVVSGKSVDTAGRGTP